MLHGLCDVLLFANSSTHSNSFKLVKPSSAAVVVLETFLATELWTFRIVFLMLL